MVNWQNCTENKKVPFNLSQLLLSGNRQRKEIPMNKCCAVCTGVSRCGIYCPWQLEQECLQKQERTVHMQGQKVTLLSSTLRSVNSK